MRLALLTALLLVVRPALALAPAVAASAEAAPAAAPAAAEPEADPAVRSTAALEQLHEVLRAMLARLEEVRRTRDVVRLNCVNEKLTQVKGLVRISDQANAALREALARDEGKVVRHEATKVGLARDKALKLRAESEQCIGALSFRTDENLSVEVEEPTNLAGGDPTAPTPPDAVVVRPPPASPTE